MVIKVILFFLVVIIMLIGLIGEILPVLPGMILIWLAALVYGIVDGFKDFSIYSLILMIIIWLIAAGMDLLAAWLTSRHLGVSWWGLGGGIIGFLIGLFFVNILVIILATAIGAFIGEYYKLRHAGHALKASAGALIGLAIGGAAKIVLAVLMILIFLLAVIF